MPSTPQPIEALVTNAATTLYTAFTGSPTRGMMISLDLTNITDSDITIDVWLDIGGAVLRYLADDMSIPARGTASWRGMVTLNNAGELIRAQSSAADSVHALGTVIENA